MVGGRKLGEWGWGDFAFVAKLVAGLAAFLVFVFS